MKTILISIGDELLIGQTVNTNAAWLGAELTKRGIEVSKALTIADTREAILGALAECFEEADLIITTGGLGPTKDDITKITLCDFFEDTLVLDAEVLNRIEDFFKARGREVLDVNRQQAALPSRSELLPNDVGTASGMWIKRDDKVLISLPGVPYEMKDIMIKYGFPKILAHFKTQSIYHRTVLTTGIGETTIAERMSDWETRVRNLGFGLAYLPSPGQVKLRITSHRGKEDAEQIDVLLDEIFKSLPKNAYAFGDLELSEVVGQLLRESGKVVGTVESCTGGALAQEIVSISGSSDYFMGSFLTYTNELKHRMVDVPEYLFETVGAVSKDVVEQMATAGREKLNVDYCMSTSGIAGPTGGTLEKPVGTVWIALAGPFGVKSKRFQFGDHRERNIRLSVLSALNMLRCELLGID